MLSRLVETILNLSGPAAYGLVGLLAFGEAAAFVGLLLPGELAVLLGGVVASGGQASLPVMIAVASVAAIAGDSVGYEIGRWYGPRILAWPPFERRFGSQVARASAYLEERGGRAVFLGRWTSLLRALVPGLAGMARMPYGRFLVFNVLGGVAWATTFVVAGYLAGASWRRIERIAGRASLILLAIVVVGLVVRWLTRRLTERADQVRARLRAAAASWPVRWVSARIEGPVLWTRRRADPVLALGVGWLAGLAVAALAGWVVGATVQGLLVREDLFLLDRPIATWVANRTTPVAVAVADGIIRTLGPPAGAWWVLAVAVVVGRWDGTSAAVRAVAAPVAAAGLALGLQQVLPTTAVGTAFPSLAVTWVAAGTVAAVVGVARFVGTVAAIRTAGVVTFAVVLVAAAELITGAASASGVAGGAALGVFVALLGEMVSGVTATGRDTGVAHR